MKSSISALILAIIGTLYAPAMDSAELRSLSPIRDFLIDSSKPYVYLEIDHIGPRTPGNEHEPNTGIYLRLKNNCRLPIIVSTFGGPVGGTDGEVGVMDEVVLNPTAIYGDMDGTGGDSKTVPLLLNTPDELLSPEMKKAKARLQFEEQEKAKTESEQENARLEAAAKELADRPTGYLFDVESATAIPPGMAVYFSVPVNHVNKKWHLQISFRFALKRQGPIRQPYNYVALFWDDLPESYRATNSEPAVLKPSPPGSTYLHKFVHAEPPKPQ